MTTDTKNVKGVLGHKLGMTQVWDENGRLVPVTVIQAGPCVVTQVRDAATDGYGAVQIAYGDIDPRKVNKPMKGHFEKAGVTPAATSSSCAPPTSPTTRSARRSPPRRSRPGRRSTPALRPRARASPAS